MSTAIHTPRDAVVLVMSFAEAKGLQALAREGAAAILTDPKAARSYVGNATAQAAALRAHAALSDAVGRHT